MVFFVWWAYAVPDVKYALFRLALTAYIVFLLSLSGLPAATVVLRRAEYTTRSGCWLIWMCSGGPCGGFAWNAGWIVEKKAA